MQHGVIGLLTDYDRNGKHIDEAPPYRLVEIVERRRHENIAYERGRNAAFDIWLKEKSEKIPEQPASQQRPMNFE